MTIIIDNRGSGEAKLVELLRANHLVVEYKHLDSADIAILGETISIGIERKTVNDLRCSVMGSKKSYEKSNKHFYSQIEVMKNTYNKTLLIIEGYFDKSDNTLMGIRNSVLVGWQMPIIFTENLEETASEITKLFLKYGNYKGSTVPIAVHKAKSVKDIRIAMGCCIEGVGIVTSKELNKKEPLWISSVLGEEYLDSSLSEIKGLSGTPKKDRIRKRILDLVYCRE